MATKSTFGVFDLCQRNFFLRIMLSLVIVYGFYSFQSQDNQREEEWTSENFSSEGQCQAMFTISLLELIQANSFSAVEADSSSNKLLIDYKGLRKAIMALIKARPYGASTELYGAISRYLPSLIKTIDFNDSGKHRHRKQPYLFNDYDRDIVMPENLTRHQESFLNLTTGHVPFPNMVSEIPANPFSLSSSRKYRPKVIKDRFDILPFSRLTLEDGKFPYIPCKIRAYSIHDIKRCIQARRERNETTWIGFVGDSKLRFRFEDTLDSIRDFQWKIFVMGQEVPWEHYMYTLRPTKLIANTDALSPAGLKLSFAFSTKGEVTQYAGVKIPIINSTQWLQEGADVPDIILIGFGSWIYRESHTDDLPTMKAEDEIIAHWKAMKEIVSRLAKRTTVLLMPQSRARTHLVDASVPFNDSMVSMVRWYHHIFYLSSFRDHSNNWIDQVMSHFAKDTGAILWDSTLPLNLANVRECALLKEAKQENHPAYDDVMRCSDVHHPSPVTTQDEIMMILNLLCNKRLGEQYKYCCS